MVAHIYREWCVLLSINIQSLALGMAYGFSAILTPVITSDKSDICVTREQASWITAGRPAAGVAGFICFPHVMQVFGRRVSNVTLNLIMLIGTITIALAPNLTALIIGRAIQGIACCKIKTDNLLIAEYSHPRRRGVAIAMSLLFIQLGVILCYALSLKLNWRQIAWVHTLPSIIGLFATVTWPESPSWLAYKGRYNECEDAFQWLRGTDIESRKELRELIASQKELKKLRDSSSSIARTVKVFRSRKFLKPLFIAITFIFFHEGSGIYFVYAYAVEIMTELIGNKTYALYFSIGLCAAKLLALSLSTFSVRRFSRRILIFSTSALSIIVLGLTCLLDYLNKSHVLDLPMLSALMLMLYCFVKNLALPIAAVAKGEIMPIEFKGIGLTVYGTIHALASTLVLKVTSNMLETLLFYGTFSVFLLVFTSSTILLYFILPETKDKTLQEIENNFLKVKLTDVDEENAINICVNRK